MGWEQLAMLAASTAGGIATSNWEDRRQVRQQKRLQGVQIGGQREMAGYNQQLALDMWNKTNYEAQRKQLEKAGLNPGLMYGMGGGGGTTAQTPPGNTTGATASGSKGEIGMGMQMGLMSAMQQAQIELTKAQTAKTKVETEKTAGVDTTKTTAETLNTQQKTENDKIQGQILEIAAKANLADVDRKKLENLAKQIEIDTAAGKQPSEIQKAKAEASKTTSEAETAKLDAEYAKWRNDLAAQGLNTNDDAGLRVLYKVLQSAGIDPMQIVKDAANWLKK